MIKTIIGLGNPGAAYEKTRHSVGFMVVNALADQYGSLWRPQHNYFVCDIVVGEQKVALIKPQTFMNNSGNIFPYLQKKGIGASDILVVHDELEMPFGRVAIKFGGSARGHNGLKSIMTYVGDQFMRCRIGIGRPLDKDDVSSWVLEQFRQDEQAVAVMIKFAVDTIVKEIEKK